MADDVARKITKNFEQLRPIKALDTNPRVLFNFSRVDELFAMAVEVETGFKKITGKGGTVEQVNKDALKWVQGKAAANLEEKIQANQRYVRTRTKRLASAIRSPKYSQASDTGFAFLISSPELLAAVPYYLAVESGSRASVGRIIPLLFLGKNQLPGLDSQPKASTLADRLRSPQRPTSARGSGSGSRLPTTRNSDGQSLFKTDRIIGPGEFKRRAGSEAGALKGKHFDRQNAFFVKIKRPVPAYHYAEDAMREFEEKDIWGNLIRARKKTLQSLLVGKFKNFQGPASLSRNHA